MPKKADTPEEQVTEKLDAQEGQVPQTAEAPVEQQAPKVLKAFTFPTIGQGVTIWAVDQADADAQAAVHPLRKVS